MRLAPCRCHAETNNQQCEHTTLLQLKFTTTPHPPIPKSPILCDFNRTMHGFYSQTHTGLHSRQPCLFHCKSRTSTFTKQGCSSPMSSHTSSGPATPSECQTSAVDCSCSLIFFLKKKKRLDVVFVKGFAHGECSKRTRMKHEKRAWN